MNRMTTDTDHAADACDYAWCQAHRPCSCPYAQIQPHRAAGCRYANDDQEGASVR